MTTPSDQTTSAEARERLRGMALSLATGSGPIVEPRAFVAALDAYQDALLAEAAVPAVVEPPADRAAVYADTARTATETAARLRAEGHTTRALGAEDVADLLHAAARDAAHRMSDETPAAQPDQYRLLLERLEAGRARALASAGHGEPEVALTASGMASGYLHAAADAVFVFEGPEAAQAYVQRATGAASPPA